MKYYQDMYGNFEGWDSPKKLRKPKAYERETPQPDTRTCWRFHYSNPQSQGALLCETANFPDFIDTRKYEVVDGYFDRIEGWHPKGYDKAFDFKKGINWQSLNDEGLKKFTELMFELTKPVEHVRIIYYYNVATGYDCPYIFAFFKKEETKENKKVV